MDWSQLLNLDADVLINEVFPHLSDQDLLSLCSAHPRFMEICSREIVWQLRTPQRFPNTIKPDNLSWRNWYQQIMRFPYYLRPDSQGDPQVFDVRTSTYVNRFSADRLFSLLWFLHRVEPIEIPFEPSPPPLPRRGRKPAPFNPVKPGVSPPEMVLLFNKLKNYTEADWLWILKLQLAKIGRLL